MIFVHVDIVPHIPRGYIVLYVGNGVILLYIILDEDVVLFGDIVRHLYMIAVSAKNFRTINDQQKKNSNPRHVQFI